MLCCSRLAGSSCKFETKNLSSSALGDNILKFIDMPGRVLIDMMKLVQRDHKLDSYKLDSVAEHFTGERKHDVSPKEIFRLFKGDSNDRRIIAEYCVQDCELVNNLIIKLEVIANNVGMANVCHVPLSFIFMRGQGIKIFSLVLNQCDKEGFVVPVVTHSRRPSAPNKQDVVVEEDASYEGAIVLDPLSGLYLDEPVTVLDYASLYPSSMISENLSHCCIVMDKKYDNLPGVEYVDIEYDVFNAKKDVKTTKVCRFAQNKQGLIPRTLELLLTARKKTRARMTQKAIVCSCFGETRTLFGTISQSFEDYIEVKLSEDCMPTMSTRTINVKKKDIGQISDRFNSFQKAVLDGMQNAYKVTANSLYGQMGAQTSQLYLKDIAACTTATGRTMIMKAKQFLESSYNATVIYGDTDSLFCIFPNPESLKGTGAIARSMDIAKDASKIFKKMIKHPHDLEYDKTFFPFILLSKKRYVGNMYEESPEKFKLKSMGIVLKRRDNAPVVKRVYGGVIDILLNKRDLKVAVEFLKSELTRITNGEVPLEELVISKSLRLTYKDPTKIAHKVLAERIGERDAGNKPQVGDRIPFVYCVQPHSSSKGAKKILQGERIEHPQFIRDNGLVPDYHFYITNQIMKPIIQIFSLVVQDLGGFDKPTNYFSIMEHKIREDSKTKKVKDLEKTVETKLCTLKEKITTDILFSPLLGQLVCKNNGIRPITDFFKIRVVRI